jgi:hypothetical protein
VGVVYANSGIFLGDAVTGNNAAFAGIPGFTPLGTNVVMQFGGNVNSYSQLNFQNINNGTYASTDYIATADNGNDTSYYVNMGIASSTYDYPDFAVYEPSDAYLHNNGGNLLINPETAGKVIKFVVGGTDASNIVGTVSATGIAVTGTVSATGNTSGGNVTTAGQVTATGNVTGGNLSAGSGLISTTGNVNGGNLITGGIISATGNINGTGAVFSGNVTASNFIGNISGNIDAGGANTNIQFNDGDILAGSAAFTFDKTSNAVIASGNITGGNLISNGNILATSAANVTFGDNTWMFTGYTTLNTAGIFHNTGANPDTMQVSTGSLANGIAMWTNGVANSYVTSTGGIEFVTGATLNAYSNPTGGTSTVQITSSGITTGANITATGNVTGANVVGTTSVTGGNIVISGDNITDTNGRVNFNTAGADVDFAVNGDTTANVFYVDAGTGTASFGSATQTTNAVVAFNATNSVLMPVGNTQQRPSTGVTGMLRFNSTSDSLEIYDNSEWTTVGVPSFTVIADEQFNGDGVTVAFTLGSTQTTASCIVSINGVVQLPTIAYSVSGTTLTFTEAPQAGDIIDVRQITTTTTVTAISNTPGTAIVQPNSTLAQTDITGNLIPTANVTYNLGSLTARWNELFLAGNTLTLGSIVIKDTGGQIGFFESNGTTPATIDAASVDTTTIANGTSSMAVIASGGNIRANVGGTTVQTISTGLVAITGDLSVSGNATLSGNILGDRVQNGTTSFDIQTPSGNANITVGATSNVAVFTSTGLAVAGTVSVSGTGNVTGANLVATTAVVTPSIVNSGANGVGNIGSSTTYFNTVFAKATSAQYADLAEKYIADAEYAPGTVVVFGGDKEVTVTSTDADRAVAGVVSTNPSYIMNGSLEAEYVATVALTGRVPCRVTGTVRKGDLMVSAGYGVARAELDPRVGTVIGKALENFEGNEGVIEVVVGRF